MTRKQVRLQEEEAEIFRRLDAIKPKRRDKELANALGIEPNKISLTRHGKRLFQGRELDRARAWLESIEAEDEKAVHPTPDLPPIKSVGSGEVVELHAVDMSYAMGEGRNIDDYIESEPVAFDLALLRSITRAPPHRLRLARGVGDSMTPTLQSSDRVMIDTTQNMLKLDDRIYAISRFGAGSIKRLRTIGPGRILVKSDNPTVDDIEVDAQDLVIHGRVIWFARDV